MTFFRFIFVMCLFFCLRPVRAQLENIAALPGVKYAYVDQNGNVINGAAFGDAAGNYLTDQIIDDKKTVTVPYRVLQDKQLNVLFEFPVAVAPKKLSLTWMWAHNPKQWFDTLEVLAGNDPANLSEVAAYQHKELGREHHYDIQVDLPDKPARFFLLRVRQKAAPDRYMFGIGEVRWLATRDQKTLLTVVALQKPLLTFKRQHPCNLFEVGKDVKLAGEVLSSFAGDCRVRFQLKNYFGEIVDQQDQKQAVTAGAAVPLTIQFSGLDRGYYELSAQVEVIEDQKRSSKAEEKIRFSVVTPAEQSAQTALANGSRFGIQTNFSTAESADAFMYLGLNWVRPLLCYGPEVGDNPHQPNWAKMDGRLQFWVKDRPGLGLFEIKTFPSFAYDEKRYAAHRPKNWMTDTVPLREPYQAFIDEQIRRVPADQKFFEIWNEPWDGHSAEDFAQIAQWTLEAIKRARPDALVGPNLGPGGFTLKFLQAGGMKGMDLLTIHPYSDDFVSSPERVELRQRVRNYRRMLRETCGRDLPIYVTEIGWPTPLKGPMVNSEKRQAQYIVRAGLALYAEDVKAVMPYCAGQSEKDPAEKEHFFGFVRANMEPKPVLPAYANLARMINGSEFLGDVWIDTDVAGMLFKKGSERILVVYTDNGRRQIFLRPDAPAITLVDIMGRAQKVSVTQNRLSLEVTDDPVYIVGVGPQIEKQASRDAKNIWTDVYKRAERKIGPLTLPRELQADPAAWNAVPTIAIRDEAIPESDVSAVMKSVWDSENLYFFFDIRDDDPMVNNESGIDIWRGDCIELFISARPDAAVAGFVKPNDYQLLVSPTSKNGSPVAVLCDSYHRGQSVDGLRMAFKKTDQGYRAELAVPFKALGITPQKGTLLAMDAAIDDLDRKSGRIQITSNQRQDNFSNAYVWSLLTLE